ncbi:UDP-Glycosyltransferase/glycogen phosphorylase [Meredithblackwellia eburnea MCA 4105]
MTVANSGMHSPEIKASKDLKKHSFTAAQLRSRLFTARRPHAFHKFRSPIILVLTALSFSLYHHYYSASSSQSSTSPKPRLSHKDRGFYRTQLDFFPLRRQRPTQPNYPIPRRNRVLASEAPFPPSRDPKPVHFLSKNLDYSNTPISPHRPPPNQFTLAPDAEFNQPVIGFITTTRNPSAHLSQLAITILGQSLQNFVWIIVDDHSTLPDSLAVIDQLSSDRRVVLLRNQGRQGVASARNAALKYLLDLDYTPPYFSSVGEEDLFELTAFEKTVWMLESNPDWSIAATAQIHFGTDNSTVNAGLHSGWKNFNEKNSVPGSATYRSDALRTSKCKYDEEDFQQGGEDWDFWMCLAEAGHWGGTVPEPLAWHRTYDAQDHSSVPTIKHKVHHKRSALMTEGTFPIKHPERSVVLEPISWEAPFETNLAFHEKAIMFIIPWLYVGGADIGALHMIQHYAERGYRVTVLCTLYQFPEGVELRPYVYQFTHDIHIMPSFLRAHDFPRYIKYLVQSRGIDNIIMSNSQLTYEMLPALTEQLPHVKILDYLHNEAYNGWKSGGYPQYSIITQRHLARTVTCSEYLKQWLVERGHDEDRIGVVKLGIEISDFTPVTEEQRAEAKKNVLKLNPNVLIVSVVGRLDPQKRSDMVPLIAKELLKIGVKKDFKILMLGGGPLWGPTKERINMWGLGKTIWMMGTVKRPQDYLAATDVFLLPSMSEGISIAVAEAMAVGIPILTARAGALPEQIGEGTDSVGGILVNHTLTDEDYDSRLYAKELATLLDDKNLRRKLGENARRNVETTFDWRSTLAELDDEIDIAENIPGHTYPATTPNPAAYFAIQTVLLEAWPTSDMRHAYGVYSE